jgi:hypothetical protein
VSDFNGLVRAFLHFKHQIHLFLEVLTESCNRAVKVFRFAGRTASCISVTSRSVYFISGVFLEFFSSSRCFIKHFSEVRSCSVSGFKKGTKA